MPTTFDFAAAIRDCWSAETASTFRADNTAFGQCSVTALVAHDGLGGDILKIQVEGRWHFYNHAAGQRLDFTASQFGADIAYGDLPSNRQEALGDTTPAQYEALRLAVANHGWSWHRPPDPVAPVTGSGIMPGCEGEPTA